ncbi:MAG: pilus assembly protein FimV [Burkholderiaceae bacterium]|jgi:pilus assembly protein FimV
MIDSWWLTSTAPRDCQPMLFKISPSTIRNSDVASAHSQLGSCALKTLGAAVLATMLVSSVYAAGLGRLTVLSSLGQPLSAEIELTSVGKDEADTLMVKLASAEAFRRANIALNPAVLAMRFVVEQSGGRQFIRVSSAQPINEPFVDLLLELEGSNGVLVREYTFLLDPANLRSAQVNTASSVQGRVPSPAPVARPADSTTAIATASPPPAPVRAEPAVVTPPADKTYQIKRGDSLTQIALQSRPTGVSLDQMLVALYRANPAAFVGENMNRMRTGEILTIPTANASRGVDAQDARRVIVAQAQDFNSYRNKLAGQVTTSVPQAGADAKQSDSGRITSKVEEANNAAAESKDKLKLSKSGVTNTALPKNASVASTEESIAKDKALAEANSRVHDLERNVADLQKLLELKNKDLAEQQKRADAATKLATSAADTPPVAPPVTPAVAPPAVAPPSPVAEEKTVESPVTVTPPIVAPPAVTPAVSDAVDKPKVPTPVPVPIAAEESLIDRIVSNTYLLPALGLLLVGLGGFGIFSSRRRKKNQQFENSLLANSKLKTNSMFGSTGGESVDTSNSVFNSNFAPTSSQLDANEVDPVAEADVYIAYGRDAQAEEILKEALRTQPERNAVRLKLLEIYAARKDATAFELMASELYGRTKGEGSDWAQAASMGIALDPNNPMYVGGMVPEVSTAILTADLGAPTRPMDDLDLEALLAATQTNTEADPIEPQPPELDVSANTEPAAAARETEAVADDGLDFDLAGFNISPAASTEAPADTANPATNNSANKSDELSMDFDVPGLVTNERVTMESDFPDVASDATSIPDLALADAESLPPAFPVDMSLEEDRRSVQTDAADPLDFDLSGISLDLDPGTSFSGDAGVDLPKEKDAPSPVSGALPDTLPDTLPEDNLLNAPEMATKLDLAIAYEEIGDKEGARELLDEVIGGGSNEQIQQATVMRAKLG